jgi:hypothetical protein
MILLVLFLTFGNTFGSDHCPEKLTNVTKDQTGTDGLVPDNSGNTFFITFLENYYQNKSFYSIFVTTRESGSVSFTVRADAIEFRDEGVTTFGSVTTVRVPTSLTNISQTLGSERTVLVQAEGGRTIIVYGLNEQIVSTDAFLALPFLPNSSQSTSYTFIASSYVAFQSLKFYSLLAIIPQVRDVDTEITIHFHIGDRGSDAVIYTSSSQTVSNGDTVPLTLRNSETVYIRSNGDLTGSIVTSNYPISVLSGSSCTVVPYLIPRCDHLVEQIPPVSTWGTRFVTVPLKNRTEYDIFRFIAAYNCTDVSLSCVNATGHMARSSIFTLEEGMYKEERIPSSDFCIVKSTNRLLVMQYSVGTRVDGVNADPFMAILPPVDQYSNNYTFATPSNEIQTYRHFINLVIPATFFQPDQISFDGKMSFTADEFVELKDGSGAAFYALQKSIDGGSHTLVHSNPYSQFGLLVYGFGIRNSYGYPGAYSLGESDIDLYNLNIVDANDQCVHVLWDHPPDVTPGSLTYSVLLRNEGNVVRTISTTGTQATVCDLCSRTVYTVTLTSTSNDSMVTTQAGDSTVRVQTNGLLGLSLSDVAQTTAHATCTFQHPLNTTGARCQVSCSSAESQDDMEFVFKAPALVASSDHTSVVLRGLTAGTMYTCTAEAVGIGCGVLETHNVTVLFTTQPGSNTDISGSEILENCSVGLGIPLAIALILLAMSATLNVILLWYIKSRKKSKIMQVQPAKGDDKDSIHLLDKLYNSRPCSHE